MKNFNYKKGLTHAGVFHADDVFSSALLKLLNPEIHIERVFKVEIPLPSDTIVFDIGNGQYDHHQKDGEIRQNGVKYAAFGLLWKEFGHLLVSQKNVQAFDECFVQDIDDSDNGGRLNAMYSTISSFIPNWDNENQNMDKAFLQAVNYAVSVLQLHIQRMQSSERANELVQEALAQSDGKIVILERFCPWQDVLIPSSAKFVIFPSLRGGYSAQAIPTEIGGRDQKISFPQEWRGNGKEILEKFVPGMTFCHVGGFMVGADSKESAIMACKKAMEKGE